MQSARPHPLSCFELDRSHSIFRWLNTFFFPSISKGGEKRIADRIQKEDLVRRLAGQMDADEATATAWVNGFVETLHDSFKAGQSVTLPSFGGFYPRLEEDSWVFT